MELRDNELVDALKAAIKVAAEIGERKTEISLEYLLEAFNNGLDRMTLKALDDVLRRRGGNDFRRLAHLHPYANESNQRVH